MNRTVTLSMLTAIRPGVVDPAVHGLPTQLARGIAQQYRPGFIKKRAFPILIDTDQAIAAVIAALKTTETDELPA